MYIDCVFDNRWLDCIYCTSQEYCWAGQLSVWNFWFPYPSNLKCLLLLPWGLWLLKVYFKTLGLCLRFLQVVSFKPGEFVPRRWSQGGLLCEWEEKVEFSGVGGELCALGVKGKERHPCPPPRNSPWNSPDSWDTLLSVEVRVFQAQVLEVNTRSATKFPQSWDLRSVSPNQSALRYSHLFLFLSSSLDSFFFSLFLSMFPLFSSYCWALSPEAVRKILKAGEYLLMVCKDTIDSSAGKESACNAGDPGLIPGSGIPTEEQIGYPL